MWTGYEKCKKGMVIDMGCHGGSGRGGSSGAPENISSEVKGYKIDGNVVTLSSGKKVTINDYKDIKDKRALDFAKQKNIQDPVLSGMAIIPRDVAERAIQQSKQERINYKANMEKNVKGYDEITRAIRTNENEYEKFKRSVERGEVIHRPEKINVDELRKRYPRASAYIEAEGYAYAANSHKSILGSEAMRKIRMGKSHTQAIKEMKKKWKEYADSKAFD